ncbi:hypothetical protein HPB50_019714 [Hyalomma asiaticum]|uniref:Uncharacterized protein n=1 Tax=Hyalomma asiaticum TaxID=266040 RepID=A0ACB7SLN6_HYAAI|nr:hypothetical protein HPB50_019714 [Hyalomma asiaticum]
MAEDRASPTEATVDATVEVVEEEAATPPAPLPENLADTSGPVCRICFGEADEENGPLLEPCACKGSIAFAHKLCLEKCLCERDSDKCKICGTHIRARRKRKVSVPAH